MYEEGGLVVRAQECWLREWWFVSTCYRFEILAVSFSSLRLCLSEETLKAVGRFCLVYMLGEVKYPTQEND